VGGGRSLLAVTGVLRRPLLTEEAHRVTSFEVFFDLVFVFAVIRVTAFITHPLSGPTIAEGLLLVLLLWSTWTAYAWVANQARADTGLVRAGVTVAMAAIFVAGLVMPEAWNDHAPLDPPVVLAVSFAVARLIYLALYLRATAGDRQVRSQLLLDTIPQSLALIAIIVGAVVGGATQTAAWAIAFAVDFGGRRVGSGVRGYRLRSPSHFAERHGLVVIIAFGETLIAVGEGAGITITRWLVLAAALLGLGLEGGGALEVVVDAPLPFLDHAADARHGHAPQHHEQHAEGDQQPDELAREGADVELRHPSAVPSLR